MASKWIAPDGTVWIALAAEPHTHHRVARRWFSNRQDEELAFCRATRLGSWQAVYEQARHGRRGHESRRDVASISHPATGPPNRLRGRTEWTARL